jgi:quinone-modifying oxidoreductase subunit QmoC
MGATIKAQTVDPDFQNALASFGGGSVINCFNCGNCTAVCALSEGNTPFPRKLIRYAQLGLKDKLVQSPEPWLCYSCGECTATCPRDAKPGETMAALRRYAIASFDPTGLARRMYESSAVTLAVTLSLAAVLAFLLVSLGQAQPMHGWIFGLVPYEVVHNLGMGIFALLAIVAVVGGVGLVRNYRRSLDGDLPLKALPWPERLRVLKQLGREILSMQRHAQCDEGEAPVPWYLTPRAIHYSVMMGFLGLFTASGLDFIFIYFLGWGWFPPARVLGTISGLLMLYGVGVSSYQRYRGQATYLTSTTLSDWWLLSFLLVLAVTGFWLETAVSFGWAGGLNDTVLLIHTTMAMELLLLVMVTKLAHAIYRPLALGLYIARQQRDIYETNRGKS